MVSTVKIPRAYSEVYSFINTLGNEYIEKIIVHEPQEEEKAKIENNKLMCILIL